MHGIIPIPLDVEIDLTSKPNVIRLKEPESSDRRAANKIEAFRTAEEFATGTNAA